MATAGQYIGHSSKPQEQLIHITVRQTSTSAPHIKPWFAVIGAFEKLPPDIPLPPANLDSTFRQTKVYKIQGQDTDAPHLYILVGHEDGVAIEGWTEKGQG